MKGRRRRNRTRNWDNPVYKRARAEARKRDGYCCQFPIDGKCCGKRKQLISHHIIRWVDSPRLRYKASNMITLCRECHEKVKNIEHVYASVFKRIVQKNAKK